MPPGLRGRMKRGNDGRRRSASVNSRPLVRKRSTSDSGSRGHSPTGSGPASKRPRPTAFAESLVGHTSTSVQPTGARNPAEQANAEAASSVAMPLTGLLAMRSASQSTTDGLTLPGWMPAEHASDLQLTSSRDTLAAVLTDHSVVLPPLTSTYVNSSGAENPSYMRMSLDSLTSMMNSMDERGSAMNVDSPAVAQPPRESASSPATYQEQAIAAPWSPNEDMRRIAAQEDGSPRTPLASPGNAGPSAPSSPSRCTRPGSSISDVTMSHAGQTEAGEDGLEPLGHLGGVENALQSTLDALRGVQAHGQGSPTATTVTITTVSGDTVKTVTATITAPAPTA
ncbi:uncharacterized protein B0H18DRAFT_950744 [Fomitopsis serialis]|uniref:uncharacterized protein n=1 Tax=Fomitopsis serialis TaxID=139415 RepID=UPI00200819B9|nr:uncharacterized protein B0H18DRAFT_950734 [Neoantrodia serialis]XP_047899841.1 uncharacterized protein B0H18DRAFT_950744 [Neoantrodia serialis]KAH9936462.1 hypothetical protein B0H18DRAFT_950734 [Neoantrodia serialis]KAH9936477.1 hypothetical protein B0H18DRAFT_950744 [Neoantrodia serialis]